MTLPRPGVRGYEPGSRPAGPPLRANGAPPIAIVEPSSAPPLLLHPLKRPILVLVVLALAAALGWAVVRRLAELDRSETAPVGERLPVPVEVGPIERGPITLRRTFSGALEATNDFHVAPKVSGRVQTVEVDLGDVVQRGQVVATMDDDELVQSVAEAEAELAVTRASEAEAKSALEIAERAMKRFESLRDEGAASESQLDATKSDELAARAHVEVTEANVARARAALEAARIRLGYARVRAEWNGPGDERVVAERYVDEGSTVSANEALLAIVQLDPIVAVVHAPERDYARLREGQHATLVTDSYPGRSFDGRVARIAPVFRRATRQARIELLVENGDEALKPGMFVRATLELEQIDDATIVPFAALTERADAIGIFVLDAAGERVAWRPVEVGVREGSRVAVEGSDLVGLVVTLGQELCDDGSRVAVVDGPSGAGGPGAAGTDGPGTAAGSR